MILPPERLQIPFNISSFGFIFTLIGLLAWSCSAAGGVGPLWNVEATPLKGDFSWAFLFGVAGVLGEPPECIHCATSGRKLIPEYSRLLGRRHSRSI